MPVFTPPSPSRTSVNKAGDILRKVQLGEAVSYDDWNKSYETLLAFRAAHQYPLIKATNALRAIVRSEGCQIEVSQRLKRMPTILDKLRREPELELGRMQDFGGCRAVLSTVPELRRVQSRVMKAHRKRVGSDPRFKDYVTDPRDSGYRGVHVIVEYDERWIEVQLRTRVMHEWAITVERLSGRMRVNLKSPSAPPALREFFAFVSQILALEEAGESATPDQLARMQTLRDSALQFIGQESGTGEGN